LSQGAFDADVTHVSNVLSGKVTEALPDVRSAIAHTAPQYADDDDDNDNGDDDVDDVAHVDEFEAKSREWQVLTKIANAASAAPLELSFAERTQRRAPSKIEVI
jgi:hypothetical protein